MSKTYRLALVTETYPPEINGVASTLRHLVAGLRQRGHRVQVIRPRQGSDRAGEHQADAEVLVPGLPIPRYPGLRFGLPVYWRLCRLWQETPPEIVYVATEGPLGHAALAAARAAGIPTLAGFHTRFEQYSRHYAPGAAGWLPRLVARSLRHFHNRADATLVATAELRERLSADGFARVRVWGRGVDPTLFSPERRSADLRSQWGCSGSDPVLIHVGRLAPEKNLGLAIDAFTRAQAALPGARCVLVGDGPELPRLRRSFPQFVFTGAKTGVELAEHYASADLFVFPSLSETFGNVVPEAMASGLATVAFADAAARLLIRSGASGVTVARGDAAAFVAAVVATAQDPERIDRYRSAARATALTLGWDQAIDTFVAHMDEVSARRRV